MGKQEIESLVDFALFKELKKLEYYGKQVDLENISKISNLEKLIFSSHDSINIECLKPLKKLTQLHLDVKITEVDGIEEFRGFGYIYTFIQTIR